MEISGVDIEVVISVELASGTELDVATLRLSVDKSLLMTKSVGELLSVDAELL